VYRIEVFKKVHTSSLLMAATEVSSSLDFSAAELKEELGGGAPLELPPSALATSAHVGSRPL
jgi:hypothetical protein